MKKFKPLIVILFIAQAACATSVATSTPCADPSVQIQRSQELQEIRNSDQADRAWQLNLQKGDQVNVELLEQMSKNDLRRRMRVGEIFGEGCFKSATDYEAAFLIYQHGNTSDQYFQAFLWSKEALGLGANNVKGEMAMAADRYLVSIGHKELFGTQASEPTLGKCWCIQPIEDSFPETLREEYRGGLNASYTGVAYLKMLNKGMDCPVPYCKTNLMPSPRGTIPGFW